MSDDASAAAAPRADEGEPGREYADPPAPSAEPSGVPEASINGGVSPATQVLGVLVVLALLAVLVLAALHLAGVGSGVTKAEERRAAAVAAARQAVVNVTSFDYRKLTTQLKEVEATSVGTFAKELAATKPALIQEVTQQQRVSESHVVETAVGSTSAREIVVLLAVDETRKTKDDPKGTTLRYRMQVRMDIKGGTWLLAELRPVT